LLLAAMANNINQITKSYGYRDVRLYMEKVMRGLLHKLDAGIRGFGYVWIMLDRGVTGYIVPEYVGCKDACLITSM
jgi:hypothetical protein